MRKPSSTCKMGSEHLPFLILSVSLKGYEVIETRVYVCTLLNAGILSRMHFRHIVNVGLKRKASECMPLTTGRMNFYASLTSE